MYVDELCKNTVLKNELCETEWYFCYSVYNPDQVIQMLDYDSEIYQGTRFNTKYPESQSDFEVKEN